MIPAIEEVIKGYPEFEGVHPACVAVPMIDQEAFDYMVEDIKENGLLEPIVRKDGFLIDGRTRLLACYESNTEIRVRDHVGSADPWTLVNEWNILRRHLSVGQKAMFAQRWMSDEESRARERHDQLAGKPKPNGGNVATVSDVGKSRDKVADRVGVGGRSISKAKVISEYAPDVAEKVSTNEVTLEQGYKEARQRQRQSESKPVDKPSPVYDDLTTIVTAKGIESDIALPRKVVFNKTNDSVDWASWTWNPVTGCEHGCKFCYAREIANSERMRLYYPNAFEPTFHPYRLEAPRNTNKPEGGESRDGRVFVCSMADLFGKWVPKEWIQAVFDACLESPEWEYLFLTKWPARYSQMPLLEQAWYGASVIQQSDVNRIEKAMRKFETDCVKWISLEPMLSPISFSDLSWCDLVVIGSQTSTTQPEGFVPEFAPEFDWVVDAVNQCREAGVPYYLKANLGLTKPGMNLPKGMPRRGR